jgi:hypothetical protein
VIVRRGDEGRGRIWVGGVDPARVRLTFAATDLGSGDLGAFEIEIANRDARSFFVRSMANLLADAAATAGDQHAAILKAHASPPVLSRRYDRTGRGTMRGPTRSMSVRWT